MHKHVDNRVQPTQHKGRAAGDQKLASVVSEGAQQLAAVGDQAIPWLLERPGSDERATRRRLRIRARYGICLGCEARRNASSLHNSQSRLCC